MSDTSQTNPSRSPASNSIKVELLATLDGPVQHFPRGTTATVAATTMGCKVNTFESELILEQLQLQRFQRTQDPKQADIQIINTCTVTAEADRQARQLVRRIIRDNPAAWVVVTGCYAQTDPDACARIPGVDLVVGNSRKLDIPQLLEPLLRGQLPVVMVDDVDQEVSLPSQLVSGFEGRTRAFVQIQQGCDQGCTFCIIHTARGPNRSFDASLIRRQVERLVMNGYHEIVICGVDIGSWGSDFDKPLALHDLLTQLITIEGDFRLRLSSIDPAHLTDQLIEVMTDPHLCPQLHLSLQSANTLILKRMKRRATREIIYQRIAALRARVPDLVLSADVIAGFPTEEEDHFQDTLNAVEELDIAFPHVFAYSPRPGTPAARIPRQVEPGVKKARAAALRAAGRQVQHRIGTSLIGQRLDVLLETGSGPQTGAASDAKTARAANYFTVRIPLNDFPSDGWQQVEITGIDQGVLIAGDRP